MRWARAGARIASLALIGLGAGSACERSPTPTPPYRAIAFDDPPEALASRYRHAACSLPEALAGGQPGRADPAACGPFPCTSAGCYVEMCSENAGCMTGLCREGYCVAAAVHGGRACEPFGEPELGAEASFPAIDPGLASTLGCGCRPDGIAARDREICGPFPCGLEGCDVRRCEGDGDCPLGLCSSYGSWPHGYCVTDDPR